jgi:hypothetical protein
MGRYPQPQLLQYAKITSTFKNSIVGGYVVKLGENPTLSRNGYSPILRTHSRKESTFGSRQAFYFYIDTWRTQVFFYA